MGSNDHALPDNKENDIPILSHIGTGRILKRLF